MSIFGKPQYSTVTVKKKDIPKDLWTKCPKTGEIIYNRVLKENLMVVPSSGYHFPLSARDRIDSMLDEETFEEMDTGINSLDPLEFNATSSYKEKLKANQNKTKETDTVVSGIGKMGGIDVSIAVMDFRFMAASLGSAAGEKLTRAIERGADRKIPVIIVSASGGARMQEGILSLMQLAKTSALFLYSYKSDHGRSYGELRLAGRCDYRRTGSPYWFCRPTSDQGNHPARTARRFSNLRIPTGTRTD